MNINDKYEAVIGLEVHAQLLTKSKIFSGDDTSFGSPPNTQVSAITLALPGTLPKLNKEIIEMAIKLGLACHSQISPFNMFERKNYFYADLPKGYQISQDKTPICVGGYMNVEVNGNIKQVDLTRIHMEEDAGKNNHELDEHYSMVDLNRAGVPLLEIVSEPCIHSSDEAYAYLTEMRKLVRYLDVCDGNMEEGSMRCDANVSIRLKGTTELGTKVEVKNMNSIRNVKRAIDGEVARQIALLESGGVIEQQTRSFDPNDGSSFPLRSKEFAHDYRYFPEPDLPPVVITEERLESIRQKMPQLPWELADTFMNTFQLTAYDAKVLTAEKETALFFLEATKHTQNYKSLANWMMGEVRSIQHEKNRSLQTLGITSKVLCTLIELVDTGKLNSSGAKTLFHALVENPSKQPEELAITLNLIQSSDEGELATYIKEVLTKYPDKVAEYKKGKKGVIGLFMGDIMRLSKGKADPKITTKLLEEYLNQ
ncbi:MAG: Asp-tRNA(Asn)/Glu-tRNA(Gln) amidotransferase subunit GatB [Chitinophagales bacterium]|nr:Asp-tRNA(Asn)/Glu-tRNA(Gln) amidotransferase subunit GatB [Chitinophagales bacterium]